MAYAKGTGLAINGDVKRTRTNPARRGTARVIASTASHQRFSMPVARKPARNPARVR